MNHQKRRTLIFILLVFFLLGTIIVILLVTKPMPIALMQKYELSQLWHEGEVMNECAECHDSQDFHTYETCHDDHGAVELDGVRFFEVIDLTGDVPDPAFVRVNEVIPDQDNIGTHITLFDFLSQNGVEDFESVTFITNDGGLTTIVQPYLDETALLVPYVDGVRFVTVSVQSSTWLKGISRILVVGKETSIGRLLIGETVRMTVEGSDVMLTDETGETSRALVANWAEGARLLPLLENNAPIRITVTNALGEAVEFTLDEVQNAIIAIVRDSVTLILPHRGRSAWPTDIIKIESN